MQEQMSALEEWIFGQATAKPTASSAEEITPAPAAAVAAATKTETQAESDTTKSADSSPTRTTSSLPAHAATGSQPEEASLLPIQPIDPAPARTPAAQSQPMSAGSSKETAPLPGSSPSSPDNGHHGGFLKRATRKMHSVSLSSHKSNEPSVGGVPDHEASSRQVP